MTELVLEVVAEGFLGQLVDEVVESYEADNETMTTIVTALLALQKQSPAITVGTIEPTVSRSIKVEGDTIARALLKLRSTHGGYMEVDQNLAFNWWNSLGVDTGQQIRYRKNLLGITRERDYQGTCQKVFPYGAGEGTARIELDDLLVEDEEATKDEDVTYGYLALGGLYSCYKSWTGAGDALPDEMIVKENSVDVSADWTQGADEQTLRCAIGDFDNTATYEVTYRHATYLWDGTANPLVRAHTDRRVTHPLTLLAWGRLFLTDTKDPITSYAIDAYDLAASEVDGHDYIFDNLVEGSTVKVIDEDLGIDVSTTVIRLFNPDLNHPERLHIELSTVVKDLADTLAEVYDSNQLNTHIATQVGAGDVVVLGAFTVADWVTSGATTIVGSNIQTGTLAADRITTGTIGVATIELDGVTSIIKSSNYAADSAGWQIKGDGDAEFNDVKVRGSIYSSTLESGNTLTISGAIDAGGGNIRISSTEVTLVGDNSLVWRDSLGGGNARGWINCDPSNYHLELGCDGQVYIQDNMWTRDVWPTTNDTYDCGISTKYWWRGYFDNLYYKAHGAFQSHDDIALIRQMKEDPNNPGFIDKATIPSIMRKLPSETRNEDKAKCLDILNEKLSDIDNRHHIPKRERDRDKQKARQGYKALLKEIDAMPDNELCDINASNAIALAHGAIRQMADQMDALKAEVALLKGAA